MNSESSRPLDTHTFAIGVLGVTACVLFVGLVLTISQPKAALATGQTDRAGDYIMLTQQLTTSQEGIVVVDGAADRLILYAFDFNNKRLEMLDGMELARLRGEKPAGDTRPERQPRR
ncbi:MAG: hypothetical protein JNG88_09005 [Phycisphaerales bacterium]|nr:hypothetical protein [Phycisphaerales bacterium]